ncbi:hypothetical protein [Burkholderia gladioli]|uniref:hypothetical protein n=1 Tax=Burkholderia gladioli TaxID=28095 RepID=UPI00163F464F|nr:hypothetical protein [Burkholderia gladioli]
MHKLFDNIERELQAAIAAGSGDLSALIDRLDRLQNDVRGARFSAAHTLFGAGIMPAGEPETALEGVEPPIRKFAKRDSVRTSDGFLGTVVGYDRTGGVIVNVVFEARGYAEADLREVSL